MVVSPGIPLEITLAFSPAVPRAVSPDVLFVVSPEAQQDFRRVPSKADPEVPLGVSMHSSESFSRSSSWNFSRDSSGCSFGNSFEIFSGDFCRKVPSEFFWTSWNKFIIILFSFLDQFIRGLFQRLLHIFSWFPLRISIFFIFRRMLEQISREISEIIC